MEISSLVWILFCSLSVLCKYLLKASCQSRGCPPPQKKRNLERGWVSPSPPAAGHRTGNIFLIQGFNSVDAKSGCIPSPGSYLKLVGITSSQCFIPTDFSRASWTHLDKPYLCLISSTFPQHPAPLEQGCVLTTAWGMDRAGSGQEGRLTDLVFCSCW